MQINLFWCPSCLTPTRTRTAAPPVSSFLHSSLGFDSSFVLRHSSFARFPFDPTPNPIYSAIHGEGPSPRARIPRRPLPPRAHLRAPPPQQRHRRVRKTRRRPRRQLHPPRRKSPRPHRPQRRRQNHTPP